jgi:hypothetical protein
VLRKIFEHRRNDPHKMEMSSEEEERCRNEVSRGQRVLHDEELCDL